MRHGGERTRSHPTKQPHQAALASIGSHPVEPAAREAWATTEHRDSRAHRLHSRASAPGPSWAVETGHESPWVARVPRYGPRRTQRPASEDDAHHPIPPPSRPEGSGIAGFSTSPRPALAAALSLVWTVVYRRPLGWSGRPWSWWDSCDSRSPSGGKEGLQGSDHRAVARSLACQPGTRTLFFSATPCQCLPAPAPTSPTWPACSFWSGDQVSLQCSSLQSDACRVVHYLVPIEWYLYATPHCVNRDSVVNVDVLWVRTCVHR